MNEFVGVMLTSEESEKNLKRGREKEELQKNEKNGNTKKGLQVQLLKAIIQNSQQTQVFHCEKMEILCDLVEVAKKKEEREERKWERKKKKRK